MCATIWRAEFALHSSSFHDVEERFDSPLELLRRLAWDRDLDSETSAQHHLDALTPLFASNGTRSLRHRRLLWKAIVP